VSFIYTHARTAFNARLTE